MSDLVRLGIAINPELISKFDEVIKNKGYINRSEAIRDIIRDYIVKTEWDDNDQETVGVITIVYNHHTRELMDKLTDLQHEHESIINSSLHVHLDHDNCLEAIIVRGVSSQIRKFADKLVGIKGVKHGQLSRATSGKDIR